MSTSEERVPTMLTLRETARQTGLSYDRIRKLCLQGKIVYVRSGSKIFVNMDRFIDFLNHGESVSHEEI